MKIEEIANAFKGITEDVVISLKLSSINEILDEINSKSLKSATYNQDLSKDFEDKFVASVKINGVTIYFKHL